MFDAKKTYITTRNVCGHAAGMKVKPMIDNKTKEPMIGASGNTQMFSIPNGGGLYLGASDVAEDA